MIQQWNGRPAWDDYETVIVLASEEAHRALLGTTNPATLFAQLSFGPSRGFPGTTAADRGIVRLPDGAPRTKSDQPDAAAHDRFSRRGKST